MTISDLLRRVRHRYTAGVGIARSGAPLVPVSRPSDLDAFEGQAQGRSWVSR